MEARDLMKLISLNERAGQRRRRYYRLTRPGCKVLLQQRSIWETFFLALDRVARITHA
jgi:hypothetical protein